jgi:catalase
MFFKPSILHSCSMTPTITNALAPIGEEALRTLDELSGFHPGFRPVHAKGILVTGRFTPAPGAACLTCAPHLLRGSTPVTVRFSDGTGLPAIPDNDPNAAPRGMAVRFHLAEHVHTDIIAHSVDGFPARTAEEFLKFLQAAHASATATSRPTPVEEFLAAHPAALAFVQTPKPLPASFFHESFYAVNAYRFLNGEGASQYGRYRIRPDRGNAYLGGAAATRQDSNFLFADLREQLAKGPVRMRIAVQVALPEDIVDDSTVRWPNNRPETDFGELELLAVLPSNEAEQSHIIFDPIPRVVGIEPSGDPLLEPRATIYLMSGRRRRAIAAS